MKSSTKTQDSNGKAAGNPKDLTVEDVQNLLKKDLHVAMLCLQSIHDDVDALNMLAMVLHGKYMNRLHQQELAKQEEYENAHRD